MTTLSPDPGGSAPPPGPSAGTDLSAGTELGSPVPPRPRTPGQAGSPRRRRRRLVLWIAAGAAVVVAVLIAVLASATPSSQQLADSPLLGQPAPALSGSAILNGPAGGGPVTLAADRGKWLVVNFSASWCVPCQEEMPQLLLFAKQHPKNAAIVTVAYDPSDIGNLRRFLRERSVGWPAVDDTQASIAWGVTGLPDSYVVDPEGTVIAKIEGGVNASALNSLIAKYSPSASGSAAAGS